jgi:hypothetical protein
MSKTLTKKTCEYCQGLFHESRMRVHKLLKHPESFIPAADLADIKQKLSDAEAKVAELQSSVSAEPQAAELSDVERKAVLADWLNGLTVESWQLIGTDLGFMTEDSLANVADPASAEADPEIESPAPVIPGRKVLLANHGVVVAIKGK